MTRASHLCRYGGKGLGLSGGIYDNHFGVFTLRFNGHTSHRNWGLIFILPMGVPAVSPAGAGARRPTPSWGGEPTLLLASRIFFLVEAGAQLLLYIAFVSCFRFRQIVLLCVFVYPTPGLAGRRKFIYYCSFTHHVMFDHQVEMCK
jgi:hypothetical protein